MFENKILLLCEGKNEEEILNILLDDDSLIFSRDDLIERRPFPIPYNIKTPFIISSIKHYGEPIDIVRVKDSQQDQIKIPQDIKKYASADRVYDYCTKPEIEILLIINEGLMSEYNKVKNKISPKDFAKSNIMYDGKNYDQSTEFYSRYYRGHENKDKLIQNIRDYKSIHKHKSKRERYLADLLKK